MRNNLKVEIRIKVICGLGIVREQCALFCVKIFIQIANTIFLFPNSKFFLFSYCIIAMGGGSGPSENPRYIPLNLRTSDGDTVAPVIKQNSRQFPLTGFPGANDAYPVIVSSDGGSFMTMGVVADPSDPFILYAVPFNYTDDYDELPMSYKAFSAEPFNYSDTIMGLPTLKGWKLTTASGSVQTINWQGQTFALSPETVYYIGYGSDGKPTITDTESNLVDVADSFTESGQFQGVSSPNFTDYKSQSFDTAAGPLEIMEGDNRVSTWIPGTTSIQYDLQAGDELDKAKISVTRTDYNNMGISYNDGTNVENKWTFTDSGMTNPINVRRTYTTNQGLNLWTYTTIAAVTNGQDICSSLIVTGTYAQKDNEEGSYEAGAQYITAGVIGDSSNQSAISYTDTSDAGKIDVKADELDIDISFTF